MHEAPGCLDNPYKFTLRDFICRGFCISTTKRWIETVSLIYSPHKRTEKWSFEKFWVDK